MRSRPDRRQPVAWLVLVAATVLYLLIDRTASDHGGPSASTPASLAAIGLALAKVRIILRELMDVRHAPKVLRTLTDVLVMVMGACLAGTYLIGRATA